MERVLGFYRTFLFPGPVHQPQRPVQRRLQDHTDNAGLGSLDAPTHNQLQRNPQCKYPDPDVVLALLSNI